MISVPISKSTSILFTCMYLSMQADSATSVCISSNIVLSVCVCFMHSFCAGVNVCFILDHVSNAFACLHTCTSATSPIMHIFIYAIVARWLEMFRCQTHVNHHSAVLSGLALSSRLCPLTKVQVSRSLVPTSLFEHLSMGQVRIPPTQWTTSSAWSVLPWPCWLYCCRMCVSSPRDGAPEPSALFIPNQTSTLAIIVHSKRVSSVSVTTRIFRPDKKPCLNNCTLQIRALPRKHLLLSPRSWPCSVQSAQLLPPPPGLAQHFTQHMPPIARTLWACSHLSVASFKRASDAICVLLRHFASFLGLNKLSSVYVPQHFVVLVTSHNMLRLAPTSGGSNRFLANELHCVASHFDIECCALDKEALKTWRGRECPLFVHAPTELI